MTFALRPKVDIALLGELSAFIAMNEEVPRDLLAKCVRAGEALIKTDDANWGWTTLVACAAADWDVERAQTLAKAALNAMGPDPVLLCNLSISFKHLCRLDLAVESSSKAYEIAPYSAMAVKCYCDDLFMLGQHRLGLRVAENALNIDDDGEDGNGSIRDYAENHSRAIEDLTRAGIDDAEWQRELACALGVMLESRQRYEGLEISSDWDPEQGGMSILAAVKFYGTFEDEMRLVSMLAPRLADLPEWDPCALNMTYKYLVREHADAAS